MRVSLLFCRAKRFALTPSLHKRVSATLITVQEGKRTDTQSSLHKRVAAQISAISKQEG